jgi:hypothetical protein
MARVARPIILTEEEQSALVLLTRRLRSARALALRARIVLECARGQSNQEVFISFMSMNRRWAIGENAF